MSRSPWLRTGGALVAATLVALGAAALTVRGHAPPLVDEGGRPVPGGVATLEPVRLNGTTQWIAVRGHRPDLPILLYLSGGPCGSEMAWVRHYHPALERHFLVVHWDQRGAAKSYAAADWDRLAPDDYVRDAGALIDTLLARYRQPKLVLMGNSWGSMLGVRVAARWPEKLHAYVGATQQVSVLENDSLGWARTLDAARRAGDADDVATLERLGPPPYARERWVRDWWALIQRQNRYGGTPEGNRAVGDQMSVALGAPEYGLLDRWHFVWGLKRGWETVYRRLVEERLDFAREVPRLDVPVILLLARHDLVVPPDLAARWLARLDAPRKEVVWFERAGHTLVIAEAARVDSVLVERVLPLARAPARPPTPLAAARR